MTTPPGHGNADGPAALAQRLQRALSGEVPLLLAVSGGRDSMVMLELFARHAPRRVVAVATFDHGTGVAARDAVRLVRQRAQALGFRFVAAHAVAAPRGEAALRRARLAFLHREADRLGARVATAHTRDDQLETVMLRVLRDSGARGLAGLQAPGTAIRPLLDVSRAEVGQCAAELGVRWVEDPSNQSRAYARNRVRLDILPALVSAHPRLGEELLQLARDAAQLRGEVEAYVTHHIPHEVAKSSLIVARSALAGYDARELALLWPALAARAGVTLDRRGTVRLSAFTIDGAPGARIQLSGGIEVLRHRDELRLRRHFAGTSGTSHALVDGLEFHGWRFREAPGEDAGLWSAMLPPDAPLRVRFWLPGDRMVPHGAIAPRRLKGLLRDAGVDAVQRRGWPVVLANEEVVWVPGVRRSSAATDRSGRPAVRFVCERVHR